VRRLLPLLLLVPFAASACGGGSGDASRSTTTGPLSPGAFVKAGNAVCIAADKRVYAIGRLTRDPQGWKKTADSARRGVREMSVLKPPADRAVDFTRMLKYARAFTLSIQEVHLSLLKNDIDTAAAAQIAAGRLQDEVHNVAKRLGLTFCQQRMTNWPA